MNGQEVTQRAISDCVNYVHLPPAQAGKSLIWVRNNAPVEGFASGTFICLYRGNYPWAASAQHLQIYDVERLSSDEKLASNSNWKKILIENTEQQIQEAARYGYYP